jgi:hypothetical protein
VASAQLHGQVDVGSGGVSTVNHQHCLNGASRRKDKIRKKMNFHSSTQATTYLAEERYEQTVNDETWSVSAVHYTLADLGAELSDGADGLGAGVRGLDHLHELHNLHGVKEMQTHKLIGSSGSHSHVGDCEGGSVTGKYTRGLDQGAQLFVKVHLDVFLLDDGLWIK